MIVDYSSFDLDNPLLEASCEIYAIEDYHKAIEEQIEHIQQKQKAQLDDYITKHKLTSDNPEWHNARTDYYDWIDLFLPRFFRGPFIVSLYALYESIVSEIANAIEKNKLDPHLKSFSSFRKKERLSFLERAHAYFDGLNIDLCPDASTWEQLIILSKLRNAVAHANGRIESLSPPKREEIVQIVHYLPDVHAHSGYIAFGKDFVGRTTALVLSELRRLIECQREACRPRKNT